MREFIVIFFYVPHESNLLNGKLNNIAEYTTESGEIDFRKMLSTTQF